MNSRKTSEELTDEGVSGTSSDPVHHQSSLASLCSQQETHNEISNKEADMRGIHATNTQNSGTVLVERSSFTRKMDNEGVKD
jgi:hypothetical protein